MGEENETILPGQINKQAVLFEETCSNLYARTQPAKKLCTEYIFTSTKKYNASSLPRRKLEFFFAGQSFPTVLKEPRKRTQVLCSR